jgi:hypothetical protein
LSEYGEDIPFYVWDEIESRLKEKKRKKIIFYISGIAASIAIILSVFTFIYINTNNKPLYSNSKQTKKVETEKNSSPKIMVDSSSENKAVSVKTPDKKQRVIETTSGQNQSITLTGGKNNSNKLQTGINIKSNIRIATNNEVANNITKHDTINIQNNESKNDHLSEIVQSNKSASSKGTTKDSLNNKTQFKIDFLKDIPKDDKTTPNQNPINNLFTNNTIPDKPAKNTKHNWELGSHFSSGVNTNIYKITPRYSYTSPNITTPVDSNGMVSAVGPSATKGTNYKTNSVIYSTGLGLRYNIGKRCGLNAGFNYEVFQNNFFAVDYNNIKIIETPLTFSYAIINRKFVMGPTAGMGCDFYINMKNKMFFGLLGLDFEYKISRKFNISLVPAYKKDISNITGYKNHTFNFNLGLNYRL